MGRAFNARLALSLPALLSVLLLPAQAADGASPAGKHIKYRDVYVGDDPHKVVVSVCVTKEGKFVEAHVVLSSGDDDTDDVGLQKARSSRVEPLVRSGKSRPTCLHVTVNVDPGEVRP